MVTNPRYSVDALTSFAASLLSAAGMDEEKASTVARLLVLTDMMGRRTHGLAIVPLYIADIRKGAMQVTGQPEVVRDTGATLLWDGAYLPGLWLVNRAIDAAIERIARCGVVTVAIRRSHHIGCLAALAKQAADRGFVAIIANSDPAGQRVAPYGGAEPLFTPDPFAIGYPGRDHPVLVDICASITTVSMTRQKFAAGEMFEHPWLLDAAGNPTRDPAVLENAEPRGSLQLVGGQEYGHKGFGLALMIEALSQGLSGHGRRDAPARWGGNVFLQVIDAEFFAGRDEFAEQMNFISEKCRANRPIRAGQPVRVPGDQAARGIAVAMRDGVAFDAKSWEALAHCARELGVALPVVPSSSNMEPAARAAAAALIDGAAPPATGGDAAGKALHQLFTDEQAFSWKEYPLAATYAGQRTYDDHLESDLPADFERRAAANAKFLDRLHEIDRAQLGDEDQISYDLFDFVLTQRVKFDAYNEWRTPLDSDSGFHTDVIPMLEAADTRSVIGYENYIARLKDVPRYFAENIDNMRQGLKDGYTLPAEILPGVASNIDAQQFTNPEDSPLYGPFKAFPDFIPAADQVRLREAGKAAISSAVIPAFRDFRTFFRKEYMPGARKTIAASALPNGKAYYSDLVRYYATYDIAPGEVHEIGLKEVARIRAVMEQTIKAANFNGSFADFLVLLRTDPQFYAKTPVDLLKHASHIAKEIDGKLPQYFAKLPRMTYRVEPVPATLAPNYTAGRYNPGPNDGRTPGTYWVNTYALERRPLYSLPALTLHEAVPGHHLQIALARELKDLPAFRQNTYLSAFGEGWALYSETLGVEMGIYKTPYEDFGRLSFEMWRACRLVVDTGIHWKGWSRDEAIDYLRQNTALSERELRTEIDRYIAWPGQALSYKLGEIKIMALRQKAEQALGAEFDLRAFHDALLEEGTMTLPMLERHIDSYIARSGSGSARNQQFPSWIVDVI